MRSITIGLLLAAVTAAFFALLPDHWARGAAANLLTLIAAIYVGFALASQGRLSLLWQVAGCAVFVALALAGLWFDWWFLVAGLALHGLWDYLHHGERGHDAVPPWYPPFCAWYDWGVAAFLAVRYALPP